MLFCTGITSSNCLKRTNEMCVIQTYNIYIYIYIYIYVYRMLRPELMPKLFRIALKLKSVDVCRPHDNS